MAAFSVDRAKHAQLVANTVDTVTLGRDYDTIEVMNRDGAAAIYFTTDGTTPAVAGDDMLAVPAAMSSVEVSTININGTNVIKLISAGTPSYSVTGV